MCHDAGLHLWTARPPLLQNCILNTGWLHIPPTHGVGGMFCDNISTPSPGTIPWVRLGEAGQVIWTANFGILRSGITHTQTGMLAFSPLQWPEVRCVCLPSTFLLDCLLVPHQRIPHPPILQRKLSWLATEPWNFLRWRFTVLQIWAQTTWLCLAPHSTLYLY